MKIHTEINEALADCHMRTGKAAAQIYLGRTQMKRLMQWAYENQYIGDPDTAEKEGRHRPEVMGCLVYEVNDDDHCIAV
jgi:hypothetical protein